MMKTFLKGAVGALTVAAGVALFSAAGPAFAADGGYVGESVIGLRSTPVFVDQDATLSNQGELTSSLQGTHVDVAVLPTLAVDTLSASDVADQIRQQTGDTTVVVVNSGAGADRVGISSANNETKIATVINKAIASHNGDAGAALTAVHSQVISLSEGTTTSTATASSLGQDALGFGGGLVGILVVVVAGGLIVRRISRARSTQKAVGAGSNLIAIESGKSNEERLIEKSIAALQTQMQERSSDLPLSIRNSVGEVLFTLKELLPRWKEMDSYGDQKFTINNIITDYLPNMLNSYLSLPKSYLARTKQDAEGKVLNQLTILQSAVNEIQDNVYEGVEQKIEEQGKFLEAKFNPETVLKLR